MANPAVKLGPAQDLASEAFCRSVEDEVREQVNSLPPSILGPAWHHFGINGSGRKAHGMGKAARSRLCAGLARMVDSSCSPIPRRPVVAVATAIEMIHNFGLIHDDIMDQDEVRRGRKAVWAAYGTGMAILLGDILLATAVKIAASIENTRIATAFNEAVGKLIEGQLLDLGSNIGTTLEELRGIAEKKTASLFELAAMSITELACLTQGQGAAMESFSRHYGVAFQYMNDASSFFAGNDHDPRALSDIKNRRATLPAVLLVQNALSGSDLLIAHFSDDRPLTGEVACAIMRSMSSDAVRDMACQVISQELEMAQNALSAEFESCSVFALASEMLDSKILGGLISRC
jgi:geranylgeranyl diphosphate synthase type I